MPKTLTASTTWAANVVSPEGGDLRRAATVETPFQALTDRTAYLKNQTDVVGVNRLRYASSYVVAAAITDFTDGDFIVIGYDGLYRFVANAALSPFQYVTNTVWVVTVTSGGILCRIGVDPADYSGLHPNYAPVWTESTGHLAFPDVVANRIVFDSSAVSGTDAYGSHQNITGTTSWTDVTLMSIVLPALSIGDVVSVSASAYGYVTGPENVEGRLKISILDSTWAQVTVPGAASYVVQDKTGTDTTRFHLSMTGKYTLTTALAASLVTMHGQISSGASYLTLLSPIGMHVQVIRP